MVMETTEATPGRVHQRGEEVEPGAGAVGGAGEGEGVAAGGHGSGPSDTVPVTVVRTTLTRAHVVNTRNRTGTWFYLTRQYQTFIMHTSSSCTPLQNRSSGNHFTRSNCKTLGSVAPPRPRIPNPLRGPPRPRIPNPLRGPGRQTLVMSAHCGLVMRSDSTLRPPPFLLPSSHLARAWTGHLADWPHPKVLARSPRRPPLTLALGPRRCNKQRLLHRGLLHRRRGLLAASEGG